MSEDSFLRQRDLINMKRLKRLSCTVVGCGSIGSFTAITLSKMGLGKLVLFDHDNVEQHNLSNQFFAHNTIDLNKAEVTKAYCEMFQAEEQPIIVMPIKFNGHKINTNVVLASTDNMESRLKVFESALKSKECKLYIDVRMLGDNLKVFTVDLTEKERAKRFREDFLTDIKNQLAPCTATTIIYNVLMCSSLICNLIKKHVNKEPLPFHIAYGFNENYQIVDKEVFKNG